MTRRAQNLFFDNLFRISRQTATEAYLSLREIYPPILGSPKRTETVEDLGALSDLIDVFIFDGYGVLNFGAEPLPYMPAFVKGLRRTGKPAYVLTNGSSFPTRHSVIKYRSLGYAFSDGEIVSSRDEALKNLQTKIGGGERVGVICLEGSEPEKLPFNAFRVNREPEEFDQAESFCFLSSGDWDLERQKLLTDSLKKKMRPLYVCNPDVTAPLEDGFSGEPGYFSLLARKETGVLPEYFGKPFPNVFENLLEKIERETGFSNRDRILMVGDTPFTDILGGNNAGLKTLLLTSHGFLTGGNIEKSLETCGIFPDFIH